MLRNVMLSRPLARRAFDPETPEGMQRIHMAFVLVWTLSETVGLFGFVLWFLGRDWGLLAAFLIAGAVMVFEDSRPRKSQVRGKGDLARGPEGDRRLDSEKTTTEKRIRDSGRAAS